MSVQRLKLAAGYVLAVVAFAGTAILVGIFAVGCAGVGTAVVPPPVLERVPDGDCGVVSYVVRDDGGRYLGHTTVAVASPTGDCPLVPPPPAPSSE